MGLEATTMPTSSCQVRFETILPFEILTAWQEQRFRLAVSLPIFWMNTVNTVESSKIFARRQQMLVLNSVL
jgi:hypothetical protein